MAYITTRIPRFRVTKSGRAVKTGTIPRRVHIKKS